jgi:hypothetical protein
MKTKPIFVYFLAVISIMGILVNIIALALHLDLGRWMLALTLLIMGVGLIVESQIRAILMGGYSKDEANIFGHLVTGLIGLVSVINGIAILPVFNLMITGTLLTFTIFILVCEMLAIGIETILI